MRSHGRKSIHGKMMRNVFALLVVLHATGVRGADVSQVDPITCSQKCCSVELGHFESAQSYRSDEEDKLSFDAGSQFRILGTSQNFILARSVLSDQVGLVAKEFVRRPVFLRIPFFKVSLKMLKEDCAQLWSVSNSSDAGSAQPANVPTTGAAGPWQSHISLSVFGMQPVCPTARKAPNQIVKVEQGTQTNLSDHQLPVQVPASNVVNTPTGPIESVTGLPQSINETQEAVPAEPLQPQAVNDVSEGDSTPAPQIEIENIPTPAPVTQPTLPSTPAAVAAEPTVPQTPAAVVNEQSVPPAPAAVVTETPPAIIEEPEKNAPPVMTSPAPIEASTLPAKPAMEQPKIIPEVDPRPVPIMSPPPAQAPDAIQPPSPQLDSTNEAPKIIAHPVPVTPPMEPQTTDAPVTMFEDVTEPSIRPSGDITVPERIDEMIEPLIEKSVVNEPGALDDSPSIEPSAPSNTFPLDDGESFLLEYLRLIMSTIPSPVKEILSANEDKGISAHTLVLTCICGFLGAFLVLFMACLTQSSKEHVLSDYIARVEQQLFALKKEREVLLEERNERNEQLVSVQEAAITSEELVKAEEEIARLRSTIQELQESSEAKMAEAQQAELELSETIALKEVAIEELKKSNAEYIDEIRTWDGRCIELQDHLKSEQEALEQLRQNVKERDEQIETLRNALKHTRMDSENEQEAEDDDRYLDGLLEAEGYKNRIRELEAMLSALQEESEKLRTENKSSKKRLEELELEKEKTQRQLSDTEQRLSVLSDYFENREFQLQKDVMRHESLWQKNENDANGAIKQLEFYKEQNDNLHSQITTLKEEYQNTERLFKRQLMDQEKKAHENWIAFKQSSKRCDDLQAELLAMRHQLMSLQRERGSPTIAARTRPKPPPPLPLPKGVALNIPPLPLPTNAMRGNK